MEKPEILIDKWGNKIEFVPHPHKHSYWGYSNSDSEFPKYMEYYKAHKFSCVPDGTSVKNSWCSMGLAIEFVTGCKISLLDNDCFIGIKHSIYTYTFRKPEMLLYFGSHIAKVEKDLRTFKGDQNISLTLNGEKLIVEVDNDDENHDVLFGDMIRTKEYVNGSGLWMTLGNNPKENVCFDLRKAPHLLIAGAAGSGKSVLLNVILCSLLLKNPLLRMWLIDPSRNEFFHYKLKNANIAFEIDGAKEMLQGIENRINDRMKILSESGNLKIDSYNENHPEKIMHPNIVVINNFENLLLQDRKGIEPLISDICRKGEACGIHCILVTNTSREDVFTDLIKLYVPTRICLRVSDEKESINVLGVSGAEKIQNPGEMLFLKKGETVPYRVDGPMIEEQEIINTVAIADHYYPHETTFFEKIFGNKKPTIKLEKRVPSNDLIVVGNGETKVISSNEANYHTAVDGHDYERMCAQFLSYHGYANVRVTPGSGDQGIDVLCEKNGTTYGIQCKFYSGNVGNHAVQEAYSGAKYYGCAVPVVMTNSQFTKSAKELASSLGVQLWAGQDAVIHDPLYYQKVADAKRLRLMWKVGILIVPLIIEVVSNKYNFLLVLAEMAFGTVLAFVSVILAFFAKSGRREEFWWDLARMGMSFMFSYCVWVIAVFVLGVIGFLIKIFI